MNIEQGLVIQNYRFDRELGMVSDFHWWECTHIQSQVTYWSFVLPTYEYDELVVYAMDEVREWQSFQHSCCLFMEESIHWNQENLLVLTCRAPSLALPLRRVMGQLSESDVAAIFEQLTSMVAAAHQHTLDGFPAGLKIALSPDTIFVSTDSQPPTVWFLPLPLSYKARAQSTQAGVIRGEFAHMSPEEVLDQGSREAGDFFKLGSLLVEVATGEQAFQGQTDVDLINNLYQGNAAGLDNPNLPSSLRDIASQLLQVDAEQRLTDPEWLREQLSDVAYQIDSYGAVENTAMLPSSLFSPSFDEDGDASSLEGGGGSPPVVGGETPGGFGGSAPPAPPTDPAGPLPSSPEFFMPPPAPPAMAAPPMPPAPPRPSSAAPPMPSRSMRPPMPGAPPSPWMPPMGGMPPAPPAPPMPQSSAGLPGMVPDGAVLEESQASAPMQPSPDLASTQEDVPVLSKKAKGGRGGQAVSFSLGQDLQQADWEAQQAELEALSKARAGLVMGEIEPIRDESSADESLVKVLRRKGVVRNYTQMNPGKVFPLLVSIVEADLYIKMPDLPDVQQIESDKVMTIKETSPFVRIVPVLPGCLISPPEAVVDVRKEKVDVEFWVAPQAEGDLTRSARIQIWHEGLLKDEIPIPCHVVTQTLTKIASYSSVLSSLLGAVFETYGHKLSPDPNVLDTERAGLLSYLLQKTVGLLSSSGIWLGLFFLLIAFGCYLWLRPKQGDLIERFLTTDLH